MAALTRRRRAHNHKACIDSALKRARIVCAQEGARLTPLREQVLSIVWRSHRPIGAYEVLDQLAKNHKSARPPTVYRALDFLIAHGLIHKIESLNAYLGCADAGPHHDGHFLLCRKCGQAEELADRRLDNAIGRIAQNARFQPDRRVVELTGLCAACAG